MHTGYESLPKTSSIRQRLFKTIAYVILAVLALVMVQQWIVTPKSFWSVFGLLAASATIGFLFFTLLALEREPEEE